MSDADFTPLYVHVSRQLRAQILDGDYPSGAMIPSEHQLMKSFSTTRGTVRKAVDVLVNEGLVRRVHGKGCFVELQPIRHSILNFGSLTDSLRGRAEKAVSRVVSTRTVRTEGRDVFELVRLRGIASATETTFLSLDTSWIDLARFSGIDAVDFEDESLYRVFREEYQTFPRRTRVALSSQMPSAAELELLEEHSGPRGLLVAEGSAFDQDDIEIERLKIVYSSRTEFTLTTAITDLPGDQT
ncbi:GntR family transcriptional regulator [Microbacterium sp. ASV49]|uniref:GntR family transcriptional regulator n=1 Tax=Microbacterium candidum TaxID=3041922 RepID=A0ABT7N3I6_9MICO|nr:GntR family transcriptional regulator [Microbacterium sp. ASV49]MDL9981269.1 GntR family transcriptional regulator [Microbacterium sp. ASV49]